MNMQISVLMTVYKNENPKWFCEALNSILQQTHTPNEIIIVKDGLLTEELEFVLQNFIEKYDFIKVYGYPENKGLSYALNYGLKYCNNDIIARMDSDDICSKDRFEKELNVLIQNKDISIVGSNVYEFIEQQNKIVSKKIVPEKNDQIKQYLKKRSPFNHPTVMFRKQIIIKVGGYIDLPRMEDYYLWYRLIKSNFIGYNIQEELLYMRTSEDFYLRRGKGIFTSRKKLSKIMLKDKYINIFEYMYINAIYGINNIIPNFLRKILYKKVLRKKVK